MLRRPSSRPGGSSSSRWASKEATPGRSVQNDQPTMEGTLSQGAFVLGGVGKGKEERARADVPQLRLPTPEEQRPEGQEREARRRRRLGNKYFVCPSLVRTCGWQESRSFVLGSYAATWPDHSDSVGVHAVVPYVTIKGGDDQPEGISSGSRIKFVFSVRFRGFERCCPSAAIFSVGSIPRRQRKWFECSERIVS